MLTDAGFNFIANIFTLFAATGFLLWLNWKLFLLSLILVPLQLYGVVKFRPLIVNQTRTVRELNASISSFLVESLSAIKFVKLFVAEKIQHARLSDAGRRLRQSPSRGSRCSRTSAAAPPTASTFLGSALVTLYGGYMVIEGQMTIGSADSILGLPDARVQSAAGADRSLSAPAARRCFGGPHLRVPGPSDRERQRDRQRPAARGSRRDRVSSRFIQP